MCYSALAWADYHRFTLEFGAILSIGAFVKLFGDRGRGAKLKIPQAMADAFAHPTTDEDREIKAAIDAFNAALTPLLEQDLFKQKMCLADAERKLANGKPTKKAAEDQRIALNKIPDLQTRLADLRRTEPKPRDNRIFPDSYAPVMLMRDGQKVVIPMRYHCRRRACPPASTARKTAGQWHLQRATR